MPYLITQNRDGIEVPIFYTKQEQTRDAVLDNIPNTKYISTIDLYYAQIYNLEIRKEDIKKLELLKIPKGKKVYRVSKYSYEKDLIIRWERFDVNYINNDRYMSGRGCEILNTCLYNCILDCTKGGHGCLLYQSFIVAKNKEEARKKYDKLLKSKYVYSWLDVFSEEYYKYNMKINYRNEELVKMYADRLDEIQKNKKKEVK